MSESILLSAIFVGTIVLIGFIGASFGISRGFVVTAAILGGAELALWWGDRIGRHLSDWFGASVGTGRFLASMGLLLLTVVLLGIAGSLVLRSGMATRWGATLGALLGAANGALLIAMALRFYFLSYEGELTSNAVNDSIVTRVLWTNFDWFVLGFLSIATLLLLYTRFAGLALSVPDPPARAAAPRPIPPPITAYGTKSRALETPQRRYEASPAAHQANGTNGVGAKAGSGDELFAPPRQVDLPVPAAPAAQTATTASFQAVTELPSARNVVRFCPNCGMTLDASDRFCPDCGLTL